MIVLKQSTGMQKFRAEIKINGDINDYDDHSVYVYRLKHLSLSQWINEAQTFLKGIGQ